MGHKGAVTDATLDKNVPVGLTWLAMKTEHIKLNDPSAPDAKVMERAAQLLRDGAIVAFPTETVYGLGANARLPETVERLLAIKKRPLSKPFTVHVADPDDVSELVGSQVPTVGLRLMKRCWPGPLTIIFTRADGSTVGVRMPDNEIARELIQLADCPVLAPSANLSGQPPATSAEYVMKIFDGQISAVLDGGPTRFGTSSTVVRLVGEDYKIIREGALSATQLRRAMNVSILLVCSGNSCRSPIAEALCRKMLAVKLSVPPDELVEHGYDVASCGTRTTVGMPASFEAREIADELGLNLAEHISRPATKRMLASADLVYVMTPDQIETLTKFCPAAKGKVMLLDPKGRPMADPHGGDLETYRRCAFLIQEALRKRIEKL